MSQTFAELYSQHSKEVFLKQARAALAEGQDALTCAQQYAAKGKPDFVLAYLLIFDGTDEVKRDLLSRAYEQRARLSDEKADELNKQFHRPFPLIKLEAQRDRIAAQQVRQGRQLRNEMSAKLHLNLNYIKSV
jgi:hypothetical protein